MPRFSEPLSVPDPDAEAWGAMIAENNLLQAKNDPLAGTTLQRNMANIWTSLPKDDSGLTVQGRPSRITSSKLRDTLDAAQAGAQAATKRRIEEGYLPIPTGGWR